MSQEEIADATGLTPIHINRFFRRLREIKLATISDGELHNQNIDKLRDESGFDPNHLPLPSFDSRA